MGAGNTSSLAPSIRILIEESADVLERIGSNPPHRNGTSALYGRHLRQVVGSSSRRAILQSRSNLPNQSESTFPGPTQMVPQQSAYHNQSEDQVSMQMSELLQFSAMSDNQIIETINNAGDELCMPNFQMDDKTGLDWLDWFNMDVNG